jgi:hypothetical protein
VLAVALLAVGGALMAGSPSFRTMIWVWVNKITCWTPDAIQKDPVGYMKFVEKKLAGDQNKIQETWRNLGVSVAKLAKKQIAKRELLERGTAFAEDFRDVYQNANGNFPVEVRGEVYTEAQLRSQLSLLLAQNDGLTESLSEIDMEMIAANNKMEELVVQKEKTESQLALLETKRELFQAEKLSKVATWSVSDIYTIWAFVMKMVMVFRKNIPEAIRLYRKAAEGGYQDAEESLKRLEK